MDHNSDRLSIAAAFGSMASVCFKLFTTTDSYLKYTPAWSKSKFLTLFYDNIYANGKVFMYIISFVMIIVGIHLRECSQFYLIEFIFAT